VLLLDEPTGNLDSKSEQEVLTLLGRVNAEGATLAMVTHSEEVAERASRIVRLADGVIISDEPVERSLALGAR
jgi:macrolide transport system ATP-binding/permease protein